MTILQSLADYYDRMAKRGEADPIGFSREKISFGVVIDRDGRPVDVTPIHEMNGKRAVPKLLAVPASRKRAAGIAPNFLWDKTAYSLGVTAGTGKRTADEHQAFRALHLGLLADADDEGLVAFRRFLETWTPDRFADAPFSAGMLDTNIIFRLSGDRAADGSPRDIHHRPAALPLIDARIGEGTPGFCLVTGLHAPIARLHPAIKNVDNAQSAGASLVSFNLDAFKSYGREQGANAPTSEVAAARYGVALNRLLDRGSATRMRIGDATVAFWADTSGVDEESARKTEDMLALLFGAGTKFGSDQDLAETQKVHAALSLIAEGSATKLDGVDVVPGTRVHILGLSPNAARLSVRFWLTETLGELARNLTRHEADCRVEPVPWKTPPSINRLLVNTVSVQEKWENIPSLLAGEVLRAVLTGGDYPRMLLAQALMRLRAGDDATRGWHAAVIRAVLERSKQGGGAPMSLDVTEKNPGYRLGRLFALLEEAQERALGRLNASIRDRYFGAASATPAAVFPLLLRGVQNHLGKLRKDEPGSAQSLEIRLGEVMSEIETWLPRSLKLQDQGRFAIGYYHQRSERFRKHDTQGEKDA